MLLNLASDHSTEENFRLISNCMVCFRPKGEKSQEMLSRKALIDYIEIGLYNNQVFYRRHPKEFVTWNVRLFKSAGHSQEFTKGISKNPNQTF